MEAANRGAFEAGAPTIGFNITLPREQEPNRFTTPALTFRFHYFAMRKMHFAMGAKALVVFPGGFGTFDELFELVTLVQTGKAPAMPIVLVDEGYWRKVVDWDALAEGGMIGPRDLDLVGFAGRRRRRLALPEGGGDRRRRRAAFSPRKTARATCLLARGQKGAKCNYRFVVERSASATLGFQSEPNCGRNRWRFATGDGL